MDITENANRLLGELEGYRTAAEALETLRQPVERSIRAFVGEYVIPDLGALLPTGYGIDPSRYEVRSREGADKVPANFDVLLRLTHNGQPIPAIEVEKWVSARNVIAGRLRVLEGMCGLHIEVSGESVAIG